MKTIFTSVLVLAATIFSSANSQTIPTDGLVAHYKFDGNLNDDSGNSYNATSALTPSYSNSGQINGGQAINNTTIPNITNNFSGHQSEFQTQDFSYSVWVKIDSINALYTNIIENGSAVSNANSVYLRLISANLTDFRIEAGYYNSAGNSAQLDSENLPHTSIEGNWHLVTFTSEEDGTSRQMSIYLDNTLLSEVEITTSVNIDYTANPQLAIGFRAGYSTFNLQGLINDTYIYNRALTLEEVGEIYDANNVSSVGLNDLNQEALNIFPNPATDVVTLQNIEVGSTINILDGTGKTVFTAPANSNTTEINLSDFVSGMYFVQVSNQGNLVSTQKLQVK